MLAASTLTTSFSAPMMIIRPVWAENLDYEFAIIRAVALRHRVATIDTEFPGIVHQASKNHIFLSAAERYAVLKANVDVLQLIQLGLTLSDESGRLPDLGTAGKYAFAWEFNFKGFELENSLHAPDSIELLKRQGMDFDAIRSHGIDPERFAQLFVTSGLVLKGSSVSWVSFHSCYDFGYLIKTITRSNLPDSLEQFLEQVRVFFGAMVFDIKHIIKFCKGLCGGLEKVANTLRVERAVGRCHQAGSDSLLTWQVFCRMLQIYFVRGGLEKHAGVIFGLEI